MKLSRIIAVIGLLTAFSCSEEWAEEPVQATKSYALSVTAGKGGTKALNVDGTTLNATWAVGERVTVYNETKVAALGGYLEAKSSGLSTRLEGTLTGDIAVNDILTLKFLSPDDYASQDGTLAYIAAHCDYATAAVKVESISGGAIGTTAASFENQQAIVKFTLKNSAKTADVSAKPLMVTVDGREINVTPAAATNELYVAIPAVSNKAISLVATTDAGIKGFSRTGVTFQKGKYYTVTVGMSDATLVHNQSELNAAIKDGAYIVFANDIPVNAYVKIGQSITQTVTIDMAGHTLQRTGLSAADPNGYVMEVFANGNLTLLGGTLTGGWANNGGGICNYGTLSASDITITGCKAAEKGGGVFNNGTLSLSGTVSITGNTVNAGHTGGGIHSSGTLNMEGNIQIKGNTYDDVFLAPEKVITVTGELTGGAESIGVTKGTDNILTSGYSAHNTANNQFFASGTSDDLSYHDGEVYQEFVKLKYISCAFNFLTMTVERTVNDAPDSYNTVTGSTTTLSGWNVVTGHVTVNERMTCNGDVKLILADGAQLSAKKGITVSAGNTFTVYCQSYGPQMGKLIATVEIAAMEWVYYATIGGLENKQPGTIVIHGGDIKATAGRASAIGGGKLSKGADVTIFGGKVEARGTGGDGEGYPGIGSGGTVDGTYADGYTGGTLTVYGGEVYAYGGDYAAAIGGATSDSGANVSILGGLVKAWGGFRSSGIGAGEKTRFNNINGGRLTVSGGEVYAYGGDSGAGIGGGMDASGAIVHISGGKVYAYGGSEAAGVGSGEESLTGPSIHGGSLVVTGGYLYAKGSDWGAGIGAGEDADGANVTISGGTVIAEAGGDLGPARGGSIGSEDGDGHRGTLTISVGMMVHARESDSSITRYSAGERRDACWHRRYSRIEPCTEHEYDAGVCIWCGHEK